MNDEQMHTLAQLQAFLDGTTTVVFAVAADERYDFIAHTIRRFGYGRFGSRIRTRFATEFASREELMACLDHLLAGAGNASLMTPQLRHTLCDHAAGNYRILTTLSAELLAAAAQRDLAQLDENFTWMCLRNPRLLPRVVRQPVDHSRDPYEY